jgi:hypothetical protein
MYGLIPDEPGEFPGGLNTTRVIALVAIETALGAFRSIDPDQA